MSKRWVGIYDGGRSLRILFPYNHILVDKVKTLPGYWWDKNNQWWTAPANIENVTALLNFGFELGETLQAWYENQLRSSAADLPPITGLDSRLFAFQVQGVEYIEKNRGIALIGDDMGLGKTAQFLSWLGYRRKDALPAVVVVPAVAKLNWETEARMWTPFLQSRVAYGKKIPNITNFDGVDLLIINYDILPWWDELIREKLNPITLGIDEGHYIKNQAARRTKAVRSVAKGVQFKIALTGTPIINRPSEFFSLLNLLRPDLFPSWWHYHVRFCAPKMNAFGTWNYQGSSNEMELHNLLVRTVMIRRLKKDVLKELPEKQRIIVPLELSNAGEYRKAEANIIQWILDNEGPEKAAKAKNAAALVAIEKLKQIAVRGKMIAIKAWVEDFLLTGKKLVIFATHQFVIQELMEHFGKIAVKVDGSVTSKRREEAKDLFQTNPGIRLFVANKQAGGVAITLTAASDTCTIELGWTPGAEDQAEDRIYRIGQEADSVTAWYLLAAKTLELDIAELLDAKRKVIATVLDGTPPDKESLLAQILKNLVNRKEKS